MKRALSLGGNAIIGFIIGVDAAIGFAKSEVSMDLLRGQNLSYSSSGSSTSSRNRMSPYPGSKNVARSHEMAKKEEENSVVMSDLSFEGIRTLAIDPFAPPEPSASHNSVSSPVIESASPL